MGVKSEFRPGCFDYLPPREQEKKYWDPIAELGIINPDRGCLTCVGYAPSCGRRCRNPINQGNRASAFRILDELSYIDVTTTDVTAQLRQLAGLTLCLRYHQGQNWEMVEEWSRKIDALPAAERKSTRSKINTDDIEKEFMERFEELFAQYFDRMKGRDGFPYSSSAHPSFKREHVPKFGQDRKQQDFNDRQRQETERKKKEWEEQEQRKRNEDKERKKREEEAQLKNEQQQRERETRERETRERETRERETRERETRERETRERETREKETREREERNERIRQRAEQARKERERKAREQAENERKAWETAWLGYEARWDDIKKNSVKGNSVETLRQTIPWPVKSGSWKDVSGPAVEEFYREAPPRGSSPEKMFSIMKTECLRWHTDRIPRTFGKIEDGNLAALLNVVAQVAIKVRAEAAQKRGT